MTLSLPTRFESERLILRCYRAGDGAMYFTAGQKNRAHLQAYEAGNVILSAKTPEEAETVVQELCADWEARRCFFVGAFEKGSGDFAAQVYIGVVRWETPEFEIGYIADVDHEGRGFVGEAVRASLEFIFEHLQAHRVRLACSDANLRSYRLAERCGFTREAHFRQDHRHPDGSFSGTYVYGLLRSEYRG